MTFRKKLYGLLIIPILLGALVFYQMDYLENIIKISANYYNEKKEREVFSNTFLVIAMPKSASSFLTTFISKAKNRSQRGFSMQFEPNSLLFNEPSLQPYAWFKDKFDSQTSKTIGHLHLRSTGPNLQYIKKYNIPVLFLTRKLPDVVVSLHDHTLKEGMLGWLLAIPIHYFASMSKSQRYDFIIDHWLPWYINFYFGWMSTIHENPDLKKHFYHLRYEDFVKDEALEIKKMLTFFDLDTEGNEKLNSQIANFKLNPHSRFNKGKSGLGYQELSRDQIKRIEKLIEPIKDSPYVNVDDLL